VLHRLAEKTAVQLVVTDGASAFRDGDGFLARISPPQRRFFIGTTEAKNNPHHPTLRGDSP